jgi:Flp pilus assembly protein TadD
MQSSLFTCLLAAALALPVAHAADSSFNMEPSVSARLANARSAIKAQDWGTALAELGAAAREAPRDGDVHNLLGYSYRKQGTPDLAKAFVHYKMALEIDPRHRGAHEYIGEAYLMDRQPAEAENHLGALEKICGNKTCEEYADLAKSIAQYRAKNPG